MRNPQSMIELCSMFIEWPAATARAAWRAKRIVHGEMESVRSRIPFAFFRRLKIIRSYCSQRFSGWNSTSAVLFNARRHSFVWISDTSAPMFASLMPLCYSKSGLVPLDASDIERSIYDIINFRFVQNKYDKTNMGKKLKRRKKKTPHGWCLRKPIVRLATASN